MKLKSQGLQGYKKKRQKSVNGFECPNCSCKQSKPCLDSCWECGQQLRREHIVTVNADVAECGNCGKDVRYLRGYEINDGWDIEGYSCSDCGNIVEIDFNGNMHQPSEFLKNNHQSEFQAEFVDDDRLRTIAELFSYQTKIENVGFWSYDQAEFQVWLASIKNTYCGYAALNSDDVLIQLWVDEAARNQGVATGLIRHLCKYVLPKNDELHINQPTDDGREFLKSLADQNSQIFGRDVFLNY